MKKTILAVAIAAVSTGVVAEVQTPDSKGHVTVIGDTAVVTNGEDTWNLVKDEEGHGWTTLDGNHSITFDENGEYVHIDNHTDKVTKVNTGNWIVSNDPDGSVGQEVRPPLGQDNGVSVERDRHDGTSSTTMIKVHDELIGTIDTSVNENNGARVLDIRDANGDHVFAAGKLGDDIVYHDREGTIHETSKQEIKDNLNGKTRPESGGDRPELDIPNKDEIDWDNGKERPGRDDIKDNAREVIEQARDTYTEDMARMDSLEQDLYKQGQKMLELDDRMDQVMASSHAITNARPVLANAGEYAVGVGVGFAGSTEAIALGGAYQVNDSWSVSGTMNYATSTSHASSDFSAGVGAHYRFGN
ncbi:YadA-like family protein [Vibrio sp. D404a]|uniref:YadA C-terminal domain-containing protein n=1 Tax=unclassified Vibrio TaxID=2614977 RepID=UPI0025558CB6|nr:MULTISPECIES: YadA C-terminal domain-containing protein [unclassified Vibrio]MDK9736899.1 YadA-like family protein [Vibrio sp. D404a]MDK9795683.1 YadA-like family protein [Vibrio sp. D449a]